LTSRWRTSDSNSMTSRLFPIVAVFLLLHLPVGGALGQWSNRYPKVEGFAHHVYLEGYNLPTLNAGPADPAVSPDGRALAVSARGWIWKLDLAKREARRLTRTSGLDSRPAWSPDGKRIAFVRDDTKDTSIVELDIATGSEKMLVATPALDLDPIYSRDGRALFYSSAESGDLDLWRLDIETGDKKRLTTDRGLEMQPHPFAGDAQFLFISKSGNIDSIAIVDARGGSRRVLREEPIASQMRAALGPDSRTVVANLPTPEGDGWRLWLIEVGGGPPIAIAQKARMPLAPAWSPEGSAIYYVDSDNDERFHVYRVPATGGEPEDVSPVSWNWGEPTGRVVIKTHRKGAAKGLAARLSITDRSGHPLIPDLGQPRFDGQNGMVFVYSPGALALEVPAGEVRVTAVHGLAGIPATASANVRAGETATIDLELASVWNPASEGWYGGDLHQHLNYGGPYRLAPEDIVLAMQAEQLDVATPMLANLHTRMLDAEWWDWRRASPLIVFAQEVRSHFLGHVGLVGIKSLYWPWYFGPGYPVYPSLDLPNSDALNFARKQGGVNAYMHPVTRRDPFPDQIPSRGIPLELVPDALLGDLDSLEIACLWSEELGTSGLWHRLLSVGLPVAASAGSDTMHNFYRTMAIGSTRVYVKTEGPLSLNSYLAALRRGRSFVTNGPMIRFNVGNAQAGGTLSNAEGSPVSWVLDLWSAVPVEHVEVLVNGQAVWSDKGIEAAGHKQFKGQIKAPGGGWVAARAYGGATRWPVMDSYPFAHTGPIWFGKVGSTDAEAARKAARDLLRWMEVAEKTLEQGYGNAQIPRLRKRFADAREKLKAMAK
jgi:Tol biopolymer transport system component